MNSKYITDGLLARLQALVKIPHVAGGFFATIDRGDGTLGKRIVFEVFDRLALQPVASHVKATFRSLEQNSVTVGRLANDVEFDSVFEQAANMKLGRCVVLITFERSAVL